jgi:flagellar motor switch protein FliM
MDQPVFTKTEIDLLLQRARSVQPAGVDPAPGPNVEPFDFQGLSQLSADQSAKLLELHLGFGDQLGRSLSSLLGAECKATPISVEQMAFAELAKQFPECALFGTLRVQSMEASVLVQADLASLLPTIDLMLGGSGTAIETIRSLTEIEQQIFKPVIELFGTGLQLTWAAFLETSIRFEHFRADSKPLSATEKISFVKFDMQIGELHGTWILVLPMMVSGALVRKLEQQLSRAESGGSEQNRLRMKDRLLNSLFRLELFLPSSGVSMRKLANLKVGQVVVLKPRSSDPIHFNMAGINLFQASPVSCGERRGAQIKKALAIAKIEGKEAR